MMSAHRGDGGLFGSLTTTGEGGDVGGDSGLKLMAACYGAGALSALLARRSGRLALGAGHLATLAGAMAGLGVSLVVLLGTPGRTLIQPLPILFPFARLSLSVDGLSAYF